MDVSKLYKYLDVNGGLKMLKYHNLQFTNNILPQNKTEIIKVAKNLNPNIKIYQMTTDPEAFRLKAVQI